MNKLKTILALLLLLGTAVSVIAGAQEAGTAGAVAPAGTVTLVTGRATAVSPAGQIRNLFYGAKVYSGETLMTAGASYVNVVFSDGGRVLLRPESRFVIERYQYAGNAGAANTNNNANEAKHESAFFRLLKGGFRAISGLIGHKQRQDYAVQTPVATIGIRGTDYEVRYCAGDCGDIQPTPRDGLYTGVQSGGIVVNNQSGEIVLSQGQFSLVPSSGAAPVPLPVRPPALGKKPLPDPRTCD
ncbi:MAG TPA: FecR domain-containing protein [Gammaproteobacteria bacterium]|nr:FecR domain-containing protein [Gammaproteobacteria bacterium]